MSCCFPDRFNSFVSQVQQLPSHPRVQHIVGEIDRAMGIPSGIIAYGARPVVNALVKVITKILDFVKNNWGRILAYVLAWGMIIGYAGVMYGFDAVALKLTIGIGCGAGFGILAGILLYNAAYDDPTKTFSKRNVEENTPWNLLNRGIQRVDQWGTRQIVLAVAVTAILAASVFYPYVLGGAFGAMMAYQVTIKIGANKNLGRDPQALESERVALKDEVESFKESMERLEHSIELAKESERASLRSELVRLKEALGILEARVANLPHTPTTTPERADSFDGPETPDEPKS